jgi:hypothetical protein
MTKSQRSTEGKRPDRVLDVSHLRREIRTAVELALVALAPNELIDRLALAAGLLEAVGGFPRDSAPALTMLPKVTARARSALDEWHRWEKEHMPKGSA